ncbi:MAG: recombinase family protein, partial [Lachnospiraceae bacterium]|nr:recombinase family protein [Lachnospiraceae bacterium]
MRGQGIYATALYLRLSRDDADVDGGRKTESGSIKSQRDILKAYVQEHDELQIFDIYADDGYSGVDFERPEFKRMMVDVQNGKVNCVLVKDLSRFGRDYIEAGRLIQKTFPALNVRFIAVADGFDSLYADRTNS